MEPGHATAGVVSVLKAGLGVERRWWAAAYSDALWLITAKTYVSCHFFPFIFVIGPRSVGGCLGIVSQAVLAHSAPVAGSWRACASRSPPRPPAHQTVLIRSLKSKEKLPSVIARQRPLTMPQSKGLEFDGVLLWNFFKDSLVDSTEWRVLLDYVAKVEAGLAEEGEALPVGQDEAAKMIGGLFGRDTRRLLNHMDPEKLCGLCDELKQLYVGMTRANHRRGLRCPKACASLLFVGAHGTCACGDVFGRRHTEAPGH